MQDPVHDIHAALISYFDALYRGDAGLFGRLFHPDGQLYCGTDGTRLTVAQYLEIVAGRQSPELRGDPRRDEILSIQIASPTTAHARVREIFLPRLFTDELTFVRVDGQWKIMSKIWHFDAAIDPRKG